MIETWVALKGFESKYKISDKGNIFSKKYKRILKCSNNGNKHRKIVLHTKHKVISKYIHRLVAEHFLTNPNKLDTVHHTDNNPHNNCVENLCWTTRGENVRKAFKDGLHRIGENSAKAKLDNIEVLTIRTMGNKHCKELSKKYGVCEQNIRKINRGQNWKQLPMPKGLHNE